MRPGRVVAGLDERDGRGVTVVSVAVEVDAPPALVWEVVSDPANLPHWNRHIVRVAGVPEAGLDRGMTYETEMRFLGVHGRVQAQVLEWEPPRRASIRLAGLLDATVTSTVDPLDGGRSRLEHVVEYRFHGALGDVAAASLRLVGGAHFALRRGTLAQKHEIEGRSRA
jgi:uncharacterized protein YndB with AHSA1/START domain